MLVWVLKTHNDLYFAGGARQVESDPAKAIQYANEGSAFNSRPMSPGVRDWIPTEIETPSDEPWLTIAEVNEMFAEAAAMNSDETTITMHGCKKFNGRCIKLVLIADHEICEPKKRKKRR